MKPRRSLATAFAAFAAIAIFAAGCGGAGSPGAGPVGSRTLGPDATAPGAPTVGTRPTKLGTILVDARGRTLYLFEKDHGTVSNCVGACASIWPPLTPGAATATGRGVSAAKVGSSTRADGKPEITYAGHPLYTYAGDQKPGDTQGQGLNQFGAKWYVLAPSGNKIDNG